MDPEPQTKGGVARALAEAVRDLWGEEGTRAALALLPAETASAMADGGFLPINWYPTRYVVDWHAAIFRGPAGGDEETFRHAIVRSVDLGFGRTRSVLLRFATPMKLAVRAAELWRQQHSEGVLSVRSEGVSTGNVRVELRKHPFVEAPSSRIALAEILRHLIARTRVRNPRESHALQGDAFVVRLQWDVG